MGGSRSINPQTGTHHPNSKLIHLIYYVLVLTLSSARLCCVPSVCQELISLRGLAPLVRLCKEAGRRNYNDAVLVACLAVLRRVANHCGHAVFDSLQARDLIDPKLMDSFLEYSSKQESYV